MKLRKGRVTLLISAVAALLLVLPGAVAKAGVAPPPEDLLRGPIITGYFIFKPNTSKPPGVVLSLVGECEGKLVTIFEYNMGATPHYEDVSKAGLLNYRFHDLQVLPMEFRPKDAQEIVVKDVQGFVDHGTYKAAKLYLLFWVPRGK